MDKLNVNELKNIINQIWDQKTSILPDQLDEIINIILKALDDGEIRIAEKKEDIWILNQWIKKAILLSFKIKQNKLIGNNFTNINWYDKIDSKFLNWNEDNFKNAGFRAVFGAIVRHSAYIARDVVLMPCFVNMACYIDQGTMIDSYATIGSCVQIGKNCHISSNVVIAGVLEPMQDNPVIIEDNCFIGAGSVISEGTIIEKGSVIASGVYISASTKIYNRKTSEIYYGKIPPYSVVVSGNLADNKEDSSSLYAAIIVKQVDENTRLKTSINELLRL